MKRLKTITATLLVVSLFVGVGVGTAGHSAKYMIDPPGFGQS